MLLYHKYESISVFIFGYLAYFLLFKSIYNSVKNIVGFKVLPSLGDYYIYLKLRDFPGRQWLRFQASNVGGLGSIPGQKNRSHMPQLRRKKWQPTPVFLPGESRVQRSLVGCHLWGRTELATTEAEDDTLK